MMGKKMKTTFLIIFAALIVVAGYSVFIKEEGAERLFANPQGGYQFNIPSGWKVAINQYNAKNSLFGPDATDAAGLGGIEIFPGQTSISAFMNGVSAKYSATSSATIDGASGLRAQYTSFPMSGTEIVFIKDGALYNIYINSKNPADLAAFDAIVASFRFIR